MSTFIDTFNNLANLWEDFSITESRGIPQEFKNQIVNLVDKAIVKYKEAPLTCFGRDTVSQSDLEQDYTFRDTINNNEFKISLGNTDFFNITNESVSRSDPNRAHYVFSTCQFLKVSPYADENRILTDSEVDSLRQPMIDAMEDAVKLSLGQTETSQELDEEITEFIDKIIAQADTSYFKVHQVIGGDTFLATSYNGTDFQLYAKNGGKPIFEIDDNLPLTSEVLLASADEIRRRIKASLKGHSFCASCDKELTPSEVAGHYFAGSYCSDCWNNKGVKEEAAKETYN